MIIDNAIDAKFRNSLTATDLTEADRVVTLATSTPFNSASDGTLYEQALAGAAGALTITDGTSTGTFTFGKLQVPAESPTVESKSEFLLDLNMVARKDGSTMEIAYAVA